MVTKPCGERPPGDKINDHADQHHVADVARLCGANEYAIELKARHPDDRAQRGPDQEYPRGGPHLFIDA